MKNNEENVRILSYPEYVEAISYFKELIRSSGIESLENASKKVLDIVSLFEDTENNIFKENKPAILSEQNKMIIDYRDIESSKLIGEVYAIYSTAIIHMKCYNNFLSRFIALTDMFMDITKRSNENMIKIPINTKYLHECSIWEIIKQTENVTQDMADEKIDNLENKKINKPYNYCKYSSFLTNQLKLRGDLIPPFPAIIAGIIDGDIYKKQINSIYGNTQKECDKLIRINFEKDGNIVTQVSSEYEITFSEDKINKIKDEVGFKDLMRKDFDDISVAILSKINEIDEYGVQFKLEGTKDFINDLVNKYNTAANDLFNRRLTSNAVIVGRINSLYYDLFTINECLIKARSAFIGFSPSSVIVTMPIVNSINTSLDNIMMKDIKENLTVECK